MNTIILLIYFIENVDDIELEDLDRERETQQANEEEERVLSMTISPVTKAFSFLMGQTLFLRG